MVHGRIEWGVALLLMIFSVKIFPHPGLDDQLAYFERRIESEPRNAALHAERAELYRLHGALGKARRDLRTALEIDSTLAAAYRVLGRVEADEGSWWKALKAFDHFIALNPGLPHGHVEKARLLSRLRRFSDAGREWRRAADLAPGENVEWYWEGANAWALAGKAFLDSALAELDAGMNRFGPLVNLLEAGVGFAEEKGDFSGALSRLDSILAKAPRREAWLCRRGEICLHMGRTGEAQRAFQEAEKALARLPLRHRQTTAMLNLESKISRYKKELP